MPGKLSLMDLVNLSKSCPFFFSPQQPFISSNSSHLVLFLSADFSKFSCEVLMSFCSLQSTGSPRQPHFPDLMTESSWLSKWGPCSDTDIFLWPATPRETVSCRYSVLQWTLITSSSNVPLAPAPAHALFSCSSPQITALSSHLLGTNSLCSY